MCRGKLIALLLLTSRLAPTPLAVHKTPRVWRGAAYAFAMLALVASPLLHSERHQLWTSCVRGPNSPLLQDKLAHFKNPDREDLARVATFLDRNGVGGRDVCCYNSDLVSLYQTLELLPPTRFVYLQELLVFFPNRRGEIGEALDRSGHRFVVTDLVSSGLAREQAEEIGPDGPMSPPPAYQALPADRYPWSQPVVYRSGTYLVLRVDRSHANVASHRTDH